MAKELAWSIHYKKTGHCSYSGDNCDWTCLECGTQGARYDIIDEAEPTIEQVLGLAYDQMKAYEVDLSRYLVEGDSIRGHSLGIILN